MIFKDLTLLSRSHLGLRPLTHRDRITNYALLGSIQGGGARDTNPIEINYCLNSMDSVISNFSKACG